jgi:UPF0755 protein
MRTKSYQKLLRIGLAAAATLALAAAAYLSWAWRHALDPGTETYVVEAGTSLRAFARTLAERGVLAEPYSFVLLAYLKGVSRDLKAGEYRFRRGISAAELLDQIVAGRVVEYPFVLIEGWNFRQLRQALAHAPKLAQTLQGMSDAEVMAALGHAGEHPEGRFYPDTYFYSRGTTDRMILARAYEKMRRQLEKAWMHRDPDLPLSDPYEALILASIVEKETALPEERPLIAGVFINRLRRGMRLQSDPTVIYGLGERFDGNLRLADLRRDTPYNTYTRHGLPPTPIAMPGGEALRAVTRPTQTDALYFVARGDGSHEFSATLEAHNRAVVKYQLGGGRPPRPCRERRAGEKGC